MHDADFHQFPIGFLVVGVGEAPVRAALHRLPVRQFLISDVLASMPFLVDAIFHIPNQFRQTSSIERSRLH